MGRHLAKHIRNAKVADILRKNNSVFYPSISSKIPFSSDFKQSEGAGNENYHMGKQDLLPISLLSIPTGLNKKSEFFSNNIMKVNNEGYSSNSGNLVSSLAESHDEFQLAAASASSDMVNLKDFDPSKKSPAADALPPFDINGSDASMNLKPVLGIDSSNLVILENFDPIMKDDVHSTSRVHGSDFSNSIPLKTCANSPKKSVNPGSWVDLFKQNRVFSENCGRLKEMPISQNFVDLRASMKVDVADLCLLGSFSSAFPRKDDILKMRNSWKVSCHVHFHASKWLIFKFENSMDLDKVLSGGPYCFFGKPMRLFKMPRFFNFSTDLFTVKCVWVKFPNLPLNLWNDDALSSICSFLGKPLYTDLLTKQRLNLDYARCLIEIDVSQNMHKLIPILLDDGSVLYQPVVYEDLPISCAKNDHLSCDDNVGVKSDLVRDIVSDCDVKNAAALEGVVNVVCELKPDCLRFGSLDFDETIESSILGKDDKKLEVKRDEVVDDSLILNATNLCEKSVDVKDLVEDDTISENADLKADLDDKCAECSVGVESDFVVAAAMVENSDLLDKLDVDCDEHFVGVENLVDGEEVVEDVAELVDDVVLDDEFVDGEQADLAVGCDGDDNSAIDNDEEVDDVDAESDLSIADDAEFRLEENVENEELLDDVVMDVKSGDCDDEDVDDTDVQSENDDDSPSINVVESEFEDDDVSASISRDVDVVNIEKLTAYNVLIAPDATFEEQIAACKRAGMIGRLVSLGGKPFDVELDLYDDSGRLLAETVDGVTADGFDESDDDEYDSNDDDDIDDEVDKSNVESDEDIEVNADNSRVALRNYTLKVLKEAEEGGYIKCNVRPFARKSVRGEGVVLTEDDIDMDIHNEDIRLGKYKNGRYYV